MRVCKKISSPMAMIPSQPDITDILSVYLLKRSSRGIYQKVKVLIYTIQEYLDCFWLILRVNLPLVEIVEVFWLFLRSCSCFLLKTALAFYLLFIQGTKATVIVTTVSKFLMLLVSIYTTLALLFGLRLLFFIFDYYQRSYYYEYIF